MRKVAVAGLLGWAAWPVCFAADPGDFPVVAEGMEAALFARDPMVRNPCALAFDGRGRLCVGMGPQYRNPRPDTPGDSVFILLDEDGDGFADGRKEFARGFNCIQGLAWKGGDLWVANAPDLTVVRDVDGDGEADEYVRVYTDLGNLEHALHGLHWAPDGRLYMSKGNSKGLTRAPDRLAPRPFRQLWGVDAPELPDFPDPVRFDADRYEKSYHDPADDWGRTGGFLRCEDGGKALEIVARGFRNPWDIAFDDGFDWLGTDNDQTQGDKIFSPFYGAHFGWGHPWSFDWKGDEHLPTAPSSGALFEGSGTGVVFCGLADYPAPFRGVFLINDWLRRETLIYRPAWDGARLIPAEESLRVLASADGGRSMNRSFGRSYDPVDIKLGPDGGIYVASWGREYGLSVENGEQANEGRIYRLRPAGVSLSDPNAKRRAEPLSAWTARELLGDLASHVPVWRINAQEELVRRGERAALRAALSAPDVRRSVETWALWTLGRMDRETPGEDEQFARWAGAGGAPLNRRLQALRILAFRGRLPAEIRILALDPEPRVRLEWVLALRQCGQRVWAKDLVELAAVEEDRVVFYAAWGAMLSLLGQDELRLFLDDVRPGVRRAAMLALLEADALARAEIERLSADSDPVTAEWARKRLRGKAETEIRGRALAGNGGDDDGDSSAVATTPVVLPSYLSEIRASSGSRIEPGILRRGAPVYSDRSFRLRDVAEEFEGEAMLRTANDDAEAAELEIRFHCRYPAEVWIGHDVRIPRPPAWMKGFEDSEQGLITEDTMMRLYRRDFPAGEITLGANADDGVQFGRSQYVVIVRPQMLQARERSTTFDEAVGLLGDGDALRGRDLFFAKQGAGCALCHRLEGVGNVYAPDLTDIGTRADAAFVLRSILEPSADITEGFAQQVITTTNGEVWAGIVLEETGTGVRLALANGETAFVAAVEITGRESSGLSAMPATYGANLSPEQAADLTAYLLERANPDGRGR